MESRPLIFASFIGVSFLYLNEWKCLGFNEILFTFAAYFIGKHGISTKFIVRKYYQFVLENWQKRRKPLIFKPDIFGRSAKEIGSLPCEQDFKAEEISRKENDSMFLSVCDNDSNSWMVLRFSYLNEDWARIKFIWNKSGTSYEIQGNYMAEKSGKDSFKAGGFHIMLLEPLRRWRILFNGMLR